MVINFIFALFIAAVLAATTSAAPTYAPPCQQVFPGTENDATCILLSAADLSDLKIQTRAKLQSARSIMSTINQTVQACPRFLSLTPVSLHKLAMQLAYEHRLQPSLFWRDSPYKLVLVPTRLSTFLLLSL